MLGAWNFPNSRFKMDIEVTLSTVISLWDTNLRYGGFGAGFLGGNLRIDAPGDQRRKGVQQHVSQTNLTVIGCKYGEDD